MSEEPPIGFPNPDPQSLRRVLVQVKTWVEWVRKSNYFKPIFATADEIDAGIIVDKVVSPAGLSNSFHRFVIRDSLGITINAYDYGLRKNATAAENILALNAAADAVRAAINSTFGGSATGEHYIGVRVYIPPGVYNIAAGAGSNVGWDLTLIRSGLVRFDCAGAVLLPDATLAGKTVIDCLGSRYLTGVLPEVRAFVKASPPAIGLQIGRHHNTASCGEHNFQNIHMRGYFSRANVYNYNSEVCLFDHPNVWNYQATATSYAWVQDTRHMTAPITDLDITALTLNSSKPFNANTFVGGVMRKLGYDIDTNTYVAAVGCPLHLIAGKNFRFINTYFFTDDEACVVMSGDANGFFNIAFDHCHFESTLDHIFKLAVIDGTAWKASGFHIGYVNSKASVSFFEIDAAISTVNVHDFDIRIHSWTTAPSNNIFDAPAKVTLTGARVSLPNLTHWDDVASFQGDLITPSTWEHGGVVDFTSGPTVDGDAVYHKGDGLQQQIITLADDEAAAITPPANCSNHAMLIISTLNFGQAGAVVWFSLAQNLAALAAQAGTGYATMNGTVLTGTTGTDTKATISVAAGVLYLENRAGGPRVFSLTFLANR